MDITHKDILFLIAGHIDCKQAWWTFCQLCKNSAKVAAQLTATKKEEFKHIQFELYIIDEDDRGINYCDWHGRFTKGMINCRGTRVWFQPRGLDIVYDRDCDGAELEAFKQRVTDPDEDYPGDICNLRHERLSQIIKDLQGLPLEVCRFTTIGDETLQDNIDTYYELLEVIPITEKILVDVLPTSKIWRIHDLAGTIEELRKVLEYCLAHEVEFRWT